MERTRENIEKVSMLMDKVMMRQDILSTSAGTYSDLCNIQQALRWMAEADPEELSVGDKVKVIVKDLEFGGRVGHVWRVKGSDVDVKFQCGTVKTIAKCNLRKEK